jgi:hypothetical protein
MSFKQDFQAFAQGVGQWWKQVEAHAAKRASGPDRQIHHRVEQGIMNVNYKLYSAFINSSMGKGVSRSIVAVWLKVNPKSDRAKAVQEYLQTTSKPPANDGGMS